jgi:hypothetical protein
MTATGQTTTTHFSFLLYLALPALLVSGCDFVGSGHHESGSVQRLFKADALETDDQRQLIVSMRIPSLACEDPTQDTIKAVRFSPQFNNKEYYALDGKTNERVEVVDDISYSNLVFRGIDFPGGHNKGAKIPAPLSIGIGGIGESEEDREEAIDEYSGDIPKEVTVRFTGATDLSSGVSLWSADGSEGYEESYDKENVEQMIGGLKLSRRMRVTFSGGSIFDNVDNILNQGVPLGKAVVRLDMPEDGRFNEALRRGAEGRSNIEKIDETTFEIESDHPYALNQSVINELDQDFEEARQVFKDAVAPIGLVGAGLAVATFGVTAVAAGGAAAAAMVAVVAALEFVPNLVPPIEGPSPTELVSAALKSGTSFFLNERDDYNGCDFNSDGTIDVDDASSFSSAHPAESGPFVAAMEEVRRTLRKVRGSGSSDLSGFARSDAEWVDINSDESDELIVSGDTEAGSGFNPRTTVYRREGVREIETVETGLPDVGFSSIAITDTDDGNELLAISGYEEGGFNPVTEVFQITNGGLEQVDTDNLIGVGQGDLAWANYDQSGGPDLIVSGYEEMRANPAVPVTKLYRNTGDGFEEVESASSSLEDVGQSDVAWTTHPDSEADLIITGRDEAGDPMTQLYSINGGGGVEEVSSELPDVMNGAVAWGDYTGDEIPDLAISGRTTSGGGVLQVYQNGSDRLERRFENLAGFQRGDLAWVDFSGDQDLDLVLVGQTDQAESPRMVLLRNAEPEGFGEPKFFEGARFSDLAWGDFDADDNPDLAVTGESFGASYLQIYRNVDPEE